MKSMTQNATEIYCIHWNKANKYFVFQDLKDLMLKIKNDFKQMQSQFQRDMNDLGSMTNFFFPLQAYCFLNLL